MVEVLIKYMHDKGYYGVYEPTTDTLMAASNISEALVSLSNFLKDSGMIDKDILSSDDISYHLDSHTMKAMVESNVNLMKRLNNAPSGFMISSQKFGSSLTSQNKKDNNASSGDAKFGNKSFGGKKKSGFSSFSGNSNFGTSYKKFGWKG
jgi:hypothetical protein